MLDNNETSLCLCIFNMQYLPVCFEFPNLLLFHRLSRTLLSRKFENISTSSVYIFWVILIKKSSSEFVLQFIGTVGQKRKMFGPPFFPKSGNFLVFNYFSFFCFIKKYTNNLHLLFTTNFKLTAIHSSH